MNLALKVFVGSNQSFTQLLSTLTLNYFSSTDWRIDFRYGLWAVDILKDISHFPILGLRVCQYEYWLCKRSQNILSLIMFGHKFLDKDN